MIDVVVSLPKMGKVDAAMDGPCCGSITLKKIQLVVMVSVMLTNILDWVALVGKSFELLMI
jgi:hypothetical protein